MTSEDKLLKAIFGDPKFCPYCGDMLNPIEVRNALSRWLKDTYLCSKCGEFEAYVDMYRQGAKFCFTATICGVGIAVENRAGYIPLAGEKRGRLIPYDDAIKVSDELNSRLREPVNQEKQWAIVASSMREVK